MATGRSTGRTSTSKKGANRKKGGQAGPTSKTVELCTATYHAEQLPGIVMIHAAGVHNTTGYKVFFEQSPLAVFPPQFLLFHVRPAGVALKVLTPFSVSTSFQATQEVTEVVIHDADGEHVVAVSHLSDKVFAHLALDAERLTGPEAEKIVKDCIRESVGFTGPISVEDPLKKVGVHDENAVEALRDKIATSTTIGVRSKGFEILPGALDMNKDTAVSSVRDQVSQKAVKPSPAPG